MIWIIAISFLIIEIVSVPVHDQVLIEGGTYWFGTQMGIDGKILPVKLKDGAAPRKKKKVKSFMMDSDCVTNLQFTDFVLDTNYKTESENFGWSFVFDGLASKAVKDEVDGPDGHGRVKNALHWMAVKKADWSHPYGMDSTIESHSNYPVVQVSFNDAEAYCEWAGFRLPTEIEWEYAARGGLVNQTFPWGNQYEKNRMNIWEGDFPEKNLLFDGYLGPGPVHSYGVQNNYQLYNMLGNVWEWVDGGKESARILRGGSYIDSLDGKFNHAVMVSTKQVNSGDSAADNVGFRCAKSLTSPHNATKKKKKESSDSEGVDTIEL